MIATGLPASPGAAVGQVVFTAEDAEAWHAQGKPTILVTTNCKRFWTCELIGIMLSAISETVVVD